MPDTTFFIAVDDKSPLIVYSPASAWQDQNSTKDTATAEKYSQSTYHVTQNANATATISFLGTGIYVYGSKQSSHKTYAIVLDNGTRIEGFSGESTTATFESSLASIRDLPLGRHTLQIINTGGLSNTPKGTLDIDEFFVELDITHGRGKGVLLVDDDDTKQLAYSSNWGKSSLGGAATRFINDTVHETTTPGSSVTWNFWGSGVQVVGAFGPNNGAYSVSVDGKNYTRDASAEDFVASHMLFYMDNLTTTHHTLTLTHTGPKGKALTVDYVMAFNTTNGTTASGHDYDSSDNSSDDDEKKVNPGAIAAIVIVLVVLFALLGAAGFYVYRRRQSKAVAVSREARNANPDISAPAPYYGNGDLEAGMGGAEALTRSQSRASQSSGQTFVGAASDKLGHLFGQKETNAGAAPGDLDRGNGLQAKRHSKSSSFIDAWDKRDRRHPQSVYEDVDLETPQAPLPHHYNHGRSLSSPSVATPLARRRFEDEQRDSTTSFDPRAQWDPRRQGDRDRDRAYDDGRNRRQYDRDDDYDRNRYDSRTNQVPSRYR